MILAGFAQASTTQGKQDTWQHSLADPQILDAEYYVHLAQVLERGGVDMLFFDDRLAVPAVYGQSTAPAVARGSRAIKLDILTILGAISTRTSTLGLGATYSTTYHAPYHVARAFATLDHLSGGRAVWNIVTSLNDHEAANFGVEYQEAGDRYDRADEFLEIVTGLWESWEADALIMDRNTGQFADPDKVHELNYRGRWLSSRGPLSVPRPPQGWPVLLQAGQSPRGMEFAARWADLAFTLPSHRLDRARKAYAAQKELVLGRGRPFDALRILPAVQVIVGETAQVAQAQLDAFEAYASVEEELVFLSEQANFDFSTLPMDDPLRDEILDSIQGARGLLKRYFDVARDLYGPEATLRDLARAQTNHGLIRFAGDVAAVADQMEEWYRGGACDGFAIVPADLPRSFENFVRLVVPELRRRGLVSDDRPESGVLRSRLGLHPRTH